jgi:hypothetical protein
MDEDAQVSFGHLWRLVHLDTAACGKVTLHLPTTPHHQASAHTVIVWILEEILIVREYLDVFAN